MAKQPLPPETQEAIDALAIGCKAFAAAMVKASEDLAACVKRINAIRFPPPPR